MSARTAPVRVLFLSLALAVPLASEPTDPSAPPTLGPYSTAANFSDDLQGKPDSRPGAWGTGEVVIHRITFRPPVGYRVRILWVRGDFLVWPVGKVPEGTCAGALLGLQTTAPEGSDRADLAADNTFLYLQLATNGKPERAAYNHTVWEGGLLQSDHVLIVKLAVWLNDTGRRIHMEPSFVVVYQFERSDRAE
jgi:hypothetical protein